jgi:O-antigen ligase
MTLTAAQFWISASVLSLAPLPFGSVDLFWVVFWIIPLAFAALIGARVEMDTGQYRVFCVFLALCAVYAVVAAVQYLPLGLDRLGDPIWARTGFLLETPTATRLSARAEVPPVAIGHALLFVLSTVNGFLIGLSPNGMKKLVRMIRYIVLIYALYGLFALVVSPNMILWAPKTAYLGSFTSTFVNHNTAATLVGTGAILWSCAVVSAMRSLRFISLRLLLLTRANEKLAFKIIGRLFGALVCYFSLILAHSRGGVIALCIGLLLAMLLLFFRRRQWWITVGFAAIATTVIVYLISRGGRLASQGFFDDARLLVYRSCLEAIWQRPLLGSGAGTFADVFPAIRSRELSNWGVWEHAHSSPLEIAVEMGLPVAAMVVAAALAALYILGRAARRSDARSRPLLAGIAAVTALGYTHTVIDFSLQIPGYFILFCMLVGCGVAQAVSPLAEPHSAARAGRGFRGPGRLATPV